MIHLMNQPLVDLKKDPFWNDELVKVTSCLVEQQFPEMYRVQFSFFGEIFENLFHTRENLSNIRLQSAIIKENSDNIITAEETMKEKNALYEKHLKEASDTLDGLSKDKEVLIKNLAEIQAQIAEVDDKMAKLKNPFDNIRDKKTEVENSLSSIAKSKI
ncbi:hypothetical protein PIB30_043062 [Stylosanthes scabra]|uniref:Uncharacterized protein n=1 Tax=Stylosanthes scabra TaxID=79078 RepID=A0ABU6QFI1_9FABA|nr:hypothetical protein [Stylosanthes scabra]